MSRTHQEHGDKGYIEDQRKFFDKLVTHDWDTYIDPYWDEIREFDVNQILRIVPFPRTVLDIGCGCGYHDLLFAESEGVDLVVGIDYSSKSIEQANRIYSHPKVQRFVANCFDDRQMSEILNRYGKFGLVVSFQVIEHLSRPHDLLAVKANCAPDKGYIAIVTPNRQKVMSYLRKLFGQEPKLDDPLHFAEYTAEELIEMGKEYNLRVVAHFGTGFSIGLKGIKLMDTKTPLNLWVGRFFPNFANSVGIIFHKAGSTEHSSRGEHPIGQKDAK
jgi:2-polyprenyl-3-methyl-5-hydroxy-6-metoxy-1,4-benzoquinol methylase